MEGEEYMNRKSKKQRGEAEVSILIIIIIIIIISSSIRAQEGEYTPHLIPASKAILTLLVNTGAPPGAESG
jgi:hypothetical protein